MNNWIWVCKNVIDYEKVTTEPLREKWIYSIKPKPVPTSPEPKAKE
ncbi:MAG: hypothetical protein JG781_1851 [Peptococcaceae bacterium]|jgi:hypothetical protein|uniref:Uncharacterized protein n=1 Tax=Thermanaerosceptrum fracticalcis TaxID=1712410 RepID=A0A7G6E2J5_THEFR|nr:hypothetical protein [Thermanaerosceptrum fracticalcis]MBZ4654494.1 hypothetical protein [Peptococcaceae bacterium]QNB46299.1 hypothetical protein BR63_08230 [Thermanaerosceptrum fracticalcis]